MAAEYAGYINVKGIGNRKMRDIVREFSVTTLQGSCFSGPLAFDAMIEQYYNGEGKHSEHHIVMGRLCTSQSGHRQN